MDQESRDAFRLMHSTLADIARDGRATRVMVEDLAPRVRMLEKHVFGSHPPPEAGAAPLVKRQSETELEHDATKAEVLKLSASVGAIREELRQQSRAMGLAAPAAPVVVRALKFAGSREGAKMLLRLVTLAAVAYATIRGVPMQPPASSPVHLETKEPLQ